MFPTSFWTYRELDQCDSTQLRAIEIIRSGNFMGPFALSCLFQAAGFGRRGDPWLDCGQSLAVSLAWKPSAHDSAPDERWPSWISLWVWRALVSFDDRLKEVIRLKWPNDLVVGEAKLGGVLVSQFLAYGDTYRVAGLGLNLAWMAERPKEVQVTDLQSLLNRPVDRLKLIQSVLREVATGLTGAEDALSRDAAIETIRNR